MLTRILAVFAALAVIGFAAAVAPSPAVAQTGGDSTATTTATATPTATPAPGPESFAIKPRVGYLQNLRGLTRLGNKWYVGGTRSGHDKIHIFSDAGAYERSIGTCGPSMPCVIRGLTTDGTNLIAMSGDVPRLVRWAPQANANTGGTPNWSQALPDGRRYVGQGVAYDGTHVWVAASERGASAKHVLLKYNLSLSTALVATYQTNRAVGALVYLRRNKPHRSSSLPRRSHRVRRRLPRRRPRSPRLQMDSADRRNHLRIRDSLLHPQRARLHP